jgi:uncharacterized protein (DUF1810 family)
MVDPHNLQRFIDAQLASFDTALSEITRGEKRSHWMWYIFPQVAGLGYSSMAQEYAIGSMAEARAYLEHPLLGQRLRTCVATLQDLPASDAERVFGDIDAIKLRSSLTLFEAAGGDPIYGAAIERWFAGRRDEKTLEMLNRKEKQIF